jgi:hypothetical protein
MPTKTSFEIACRILVLTITATRLGALRCEQIPKLEGRTDGFSEIWKSSIRPLNTHREKAYRADFTRRGSVSFPSLHRSEAIAAVFALLWKRMITCSATTVHMVIS